MSVEANNALPDDYRLTELGPLPEEWRVVRLRKEWSRIWQNERTPQKQ